MLTISLNCCLISSLHSRLSWKWDPGFTSQFPVMVIPLSLVFHFSSHSGELLSQFLHMGVVFLVGPLALRKRLCPNPSREARTSSASLSPLARHAQRLRVACKVNVRRISAVRGLGASGTSLGGASRVGLLASVPSSR